jgi:hypothetical protein
VTLGYILIPIAIAAVVVVLGMGLLNMVRGGDPQRAQNLMRWRVTLQAVAIVVILIVIWASRRG